MSDFGFFSGPYERALRLKAFADSIAAQKEERAQRKQLFEAEMEDRKRRAAYQDFNTRLALNSMGATAITPGLERAETALTDIMGPPTSTNARINAPTGESYYMPSPERQAERAGQLAGYQRKAELDVVDPETTVSMPFGGGELGTAPQNITVRRSQAPLAAERVAQAFERMYRARHPKAAIRWETNPQGDLTAIDQNTMQVVKTFPGVGKPQTAGAGTHPYIPNMAQERKKLADQWRSGVYNQFGITDEMVAASKNPRSRAGKEAAERIRKADEALDKSITRELENRARAPKTGGQTAQTAALPQSVKASDLPALLQQTNQKRQAKGLPALDMNSLRQQLGASKVNIDEAQ